MTANKLFQLHNSLTTSQQSNNLFSLWSKEEELNYVYDSENIMICYGHTITLWQWPYWHSDNDHTDIMTMTILTLWQWPYWHYDNDHTDIMTMITLSFWQWSHCQLFLMITSNTQETFLQILSFSWDDKVVSIFISIFSHN